MLFRSEALNAIRSYTQPLQAVKPEVAAFIKNFANRDFQIIEATKRELRAITTDKISVKDRATMHEALEKGTPAERRAFIEGTGIKADVEKVLKYVEDMHKDINEVYGPLAYQMGVIGGKIPNYAKHVVREYLKDKKIGERVLGKSGYKTYVRTGKRKHATFEAGEAAGIEYLKDFNIMVKTLGEIGRAHV